MIEEEEEERRAMQFIAVLGIIGMLLLATIAIFALGCAAIPFQAEDLPAYEPAMSLTQGEADAYAEGFEDGYARRLIEEKNESGEVWKKYLNE